MQPVFLLPKLQIMKKIYLLFALCLVASVLVSAAPRYWVGPLNGNWNNSANWSATNRGPGGAGVPETTDSVIINVIALVNVDVSPTISSLRIAFGGSGNTSVTLYTSVPTVFTIRNNLFIDPFSTLKDSTSTDVPFNFIFNGATGGNATIFGNWTFEGGIPVSPGSGPTFTAQPGSRVMLTALDPVGGGGGRITYKNNTPDISSSPSTLIFSNNTTFILDNNPGGAIPNATWAQDILRDPTYGGTLGAAASTILINGNITRELRHLASVPSYGKLVVNLHALSADVSLALTNGARIRGNLEILNTNNHTLTLLASTGPSSSVQVEVGILSNGVGFGGYFNISGNNTKVTLARATSSAPATSYRLQVNKGFNQTGGNFSLQDYDNAQGTSIMAIRFDLIQTGGRFYTNSTATGPDTKFIVEMDDPPFITGPSGLFNSLKIIRMSGGTIDNGRGMVTLRLNHSVYYNPSTPTRENGVSLETPLEVGRLDLFRGPLNTTNTNILTMTDPNIATAVKIGTTGTSYVNGPLRRRTNSTEAYVFPTGKGNTSPASFVFDSCVVIPTTADTSMYRAEYFKTRYSDTQNVMLPLTGVSTAEYWDISKISGADARIKLIVNAKVPLTTNNHVLVVAHYVGGQWVSEQGSLLVPGDTSSGSVVSKPLSNFSPFTFGYYPISNIPPLYVNCPSNIIVNTDPNSCRALVQFKAESGEGSTIVYRIGSTVITSPYTFQKGITTVDVTASDISGTKTCSFTVTVNDVQAPVITNASANPATLSPADNEMKDVFIDYNVTDNCGPVTTTLSVTSNEPQMGNGGTDPDWEIIDEHHVRLRAERIGEERIYTITITSTDQSGNQTMQMVSVNVPKDKISKKIRLEVKVMPNPSKTYFNLYVKSNSDKLITMQVFDLFGRVIEVRRFYPDATIRLGDNYRPGIYLVRFSQGKVDKYVTLVKLPD